MKTSAIGVIPPSIPSAKRVRPSFGESFDEEKFESDNSETKRPQYMDEWEKNKRDSEELRDDPDSPKFINKLGKAGILLASGILTYGTAKLALNQTVKGVSKVLNGKSVQAAKSKVQAFFKKTVAPNAKKAADYVADSSVGIKVKDKYQQVASKEGVANTINLVSGKSSQIKKWFVSLKSKVTAEKIKKTIIEAISIGSGFAGTITGAGIAHEHEEAGAY
ncbi:MAG: hypothetical protein WCY19_06835 [Candidatus Gastranaerophilaceae bacterium]